MSSAHNIEFQGGGDTSPVLKFCDCGGNRLIDITRVNGTVLTINSDLIETVEETPDTVITLTTGKKIIAKESRQEIKNLVKLYQIDLREKIRI